MSVKTQKILVFIATILLVFSLGANVVLAASGSSSGGSLITPDQIEAKPPTGNEIQDVGGRILGVLQTVGVILAVIILVVLGIKYMFGSIEEQVKVKETLFPYLIGCIVVFSAFAIWKIVVNVLSKIS